MKSNKDMGADCLRIIADPGSTPEDLLAWGRANGIILHDGEIRDLFDDRDRTIRETGGNAGFEVVVKDLGFGR
jgi:hypothetical protein